jgi:hypothetical protein
MSVSSSRRRWIVVLIFLVLWAADFIRRDAGSHSASDTLRPWILDGAILAVIAFLVAGILSRRKGGAGGPPPAPIA